MSETVFVTTNGRHGSAADRGSADRYYGRPYAPHYFKGPSYQSERVEEAQMTPEEVAAYKKAFDEETDRKDWGIEPIDWD